VKVDRFLGDFLHAKRTVIIRVVLKTKEYNDILNKKGGEINK